MAAGWRRLEANDQFSAEDDVGEIELVDETLRVW